MINQSHPLSDNIHPSHPTGRPGFLGSLVSTVLWPARAPTKWLFIAVPVIAILMSLSILFPGAVAIGSPPPRIGVSFVSPFTAYAYQSWVGVIVWVVTVGILSMSLAAWCRDAVTSQPQPTRALIRFAMARGPHFFAGLILILLTFAPIYLLALAFVAIFESDHFNIRWDDPRTYVWSLLVLGLILTFWAFLRMLILPPLVALRGWHGVMSLAWRCTKGFAFRFFCQFLTLIALAFAVVWAVFLAAPTLRDAFGTQGFVNLLAGTSLIMSFLIAHWLTILMTLHIPQSILHTDQDQTEAF